MNSNLFRLIVITGACCWSQLGTAQEDLLNVYQRALQNDPIIREAENVYFATLESKPQALSSLLPQLSLSAGATTSDSEDPNPATNFQTGERSTILVGSETERDSTNFSLNLSQTIFDRGQLVTYRQADKRVARAFTDFEIAKQDLLIRVSEAYFNVLAAEDTLTAEAAAREAIGRQLEQAERRFEVGLIAITDVQESQAGYDLAIATEISAQRSLATSQMFLREIVGEYISELAGPGEEIPLESPEPADADEWVRVSLDQNLALNSSRIAAEIAQDDIDIQRGSRYPSIRLSGSYSESDSEVLRTNIFADGSARGAFSTSGPQGYNFSINFSVPIYTGGFNSSRIQQAVYQYRASMEALERVARQTERLLAMPILA